MPLEELVEVLVVVCDVSEEVEGEDEVKRVLCLERGELCCVGRQGRGWPCDEDLECAHVCPAVEEGERARERWGREAWGGQR